MTRARDFADVISGEFDLPAGALDNAQAFDAGTLMVFQQTSAPTGWTKQTTHNDKAFRCVSGSCSSGGTTAFSTAMATPSVSGSVGISGSIGNTTLSTSEIPSHNHSYNRPNLGNTDNNYSGYTNRYLTISSGVGTGSTGGGGSHNHSHSLSGSLSSSTASINVQYVDLIIASKD
jgi:subtilisin family serine protease